MKVLLVIPSSKSKPEDEVYPVFPDVILVMAAVLEKEGHTVMVYDANTSDKKPEDFIDFAPDLIGFSVVTGPKIASAQDMSITFKKALPNVKIAWGDVHPSLLPEQTLKEPYIDYVVIGAGEYALPEILSNLQNNSPAIEDIKGIAHKTDGKITLNEPREFITNLDDLPDPSWHLVDFSKYPNVTLRTSRGCPYKCSFCASASLHNCYHNDQSAERTISQLKVLKSRYNVKFIKSLGESSCFNKKRLRKICRMLIAENVDIKWNCEIRTGLSEDDVKLMAESGCVSAGVGFETGSQRMLEFLKKKTTIKALEDTTRLLIKHNIMPFLYIIYGMPTETENDLKESLDLLKRLDYPLSFFMKFAPVPGTPLHKYCLEKNLIKQPEKLDDWINFYSSYTANINFSNIPQKEIDRAVELVNKAQNSKHSKRTPAQQNLLSIFEKFAYPINLVKELVSSFKYSHITKGEPKKSQAGM